MSVNKNRPHVFVLPEDDANSRMANGFHLGVHFDLQRQMQVLPVAGGWLEVLRRFTADHIIAMARYPERFMVLLIDFDNKEDRFKTVWARIPPNLAQRVFVLGALSEPENLKQAHLGSYEMIGGKLATDCRSDVATIWAHALLRHNDKELERLRKSVRPFLFQPFEQH